MTEHQLSPYLLIQDDDQLALYTQNYDFDKWVNKSLQHDEKKQIVIRFVGQEESASLNQQFRNKPGPTNVLTFPSQVPAHLMLNESGLDEDASMILGDIAICVPVIEREAREQGKPLQAHWAHMVVHSVLHLQGYDHIDPVEAQAMEKLETRLMAELGFGDPYLDSYSPQPQKTPTPTPTPTPTQPAASGQTEQHTE